MIVDKQEENRVKYFVLIKNKCKYKIFYLLLNIPTNKWKNIKKLEGLNKICVGIPPYLCIFWKFKIISKSLKLNQCRKQPPKEKKISILPTHDPTGLNKKKCRELNFGGQISPKKGI